MKISRNDPFDLNICIRGLGNQLTYMNNDLFDYLYNMTVRPGRTPSKSEIDDFLQNDFSDGRVFLCSTNSYVSSCARIDSQIRKYKLELCVRWGINECDDMQDEMIMEEAKRYSPVLLRCKKSKNYLKVSILYGKVLTAFVDCLYTYICAFTLKSYKIPVEKEHQIKLCDQYDLRLLDENEDIVRLLNDLIYEIIDDLNAYEVLVEKRVRLFGGWDNIRLG